MTENPAKTEALGKEISFEFDGETYTVPPAREWDLDVLESYENGMIATCVRAVMGEEQYDRFKSEPAEGGERKPKRRTVGDLNDLFETLQKALGVEGN